MNYLTETEHLRRFAEEEQRANVAERSAAMWKTVAQSLLAGYVVIILFAITR